MIRFLLNEQIISVEEHKPDTTLLEYIRQSKSLCGTKEGCASGDCGACTVVLADINDNANGLTYKTINSCITYLSSIHGKQLITVEHLPSETELHPVQQAMVDCHGSQCGFCTPGFIMSMFSLYHQNAEVSHQNIEIALSGNLCRCTGYRPIIEAASLSCTSPTPDKFDKNSEQTISKLNLLKEEKGESNGYLQPTSRDELRLAISSNPLARLVCGSTDLALETTQLLNDLACLINLKNVTELNHIEEAENELRIGSALSFAEIESKLLKHFPDLKELLWRFASAPIRNQASLGGNIANASPIGDMPPVLLALNANILLDNGKARRVIPAKDFFIDYKTTQMQKDEWIESIHLPYLSKQSQLRAYKVSKRLEDDISAVCAVFKIELENNCVVKLSSGFGGIAATPRQADSLEQVIIGLDWTSRTTMEKGIAALSHYFSPIDDVRASAEYRHKMVINLWQRFWLETSAANPATTTRANAYA